MTHLTNAALDKDARTLRAEAKRESRRAHILHTALEVFANNGYHQTRVSDIIEAAGIARGTFYLYFESKSAIFLELLDHLLVQLRETVVGVETGPGAPPVKDQLLLTVTHVVRVVEDHQLLAQIILREAVGLDQDVDHKLTEFYGNLQRFIAESLENGQRMGIVRADVDTDIVASCILGSIKYILEQHVMASPDETVDVHRVGRAILEYNLRGVLA
jgi:AcrR family transcriptional regulator